MSELITKDDIKRLIKNENLKIDDIFEGEQLAEYRKRVEAELALEREKKAEEKVDTSKYIDPKRNPFIKTSI